MYNPSFLLLDQWESGFIFC